jgi:hypothetical protein
VTGRTPDRDSEARLERLRDEAARHGRVEAPGVQPEGAPFPVATGETGYYGLPLLQEPAWTREVPLYFFAGGAAGAAAVIGAAARRLGGDGGLVRDARWVAALGAGAGTALLISDLGRPERFLHMLRVFKPRSPMSVGAWTLAAFGSAAGATAFADLVRRRGGGSLPVRVVEDAGELLSAATGLVMTSYTGVLIGATVIPVWNHNVAVLPVHFTASALASAVGLLELLGHDERGLQRLGLLAAAVETASGLLHELDDDPADRPLKKGRSGWLVRSGLLLSGPLPLALRLLGARRAAAVSSLAGSLLTRFGWTEAGAASARDGELALRG